MATKPNIRKQIREARGAILQLMQEGLAPIADSLVSQIISRAKRLPPSRQLEALSGLEPAGSAAYRDLLKTTISVIAFDAINQARKEVPAKKHVKLSEHEGNMQLSEFDKLPPEMQKKIQRQIQLLVGSQQADLIKAVTFQFSGSYDSTDSYELIQKDLEQSAEDYLTGSSVQAAAGITASNVINEARNAFFRDPDVSDAVEAFQFTNGDPVSPICQDLNGTIFRTDDPEATRYEPPLHPNCDSYLLPILKGNLGNREITALKPSDSSLEKFITLSEGVNRCGCH